nr:AI-2E family transporter [bacterium]
MTKRHLLRALGILLALAVAAFAVWAFKPAVLTALWAGIITFLLSPLHARLKRRMGPGGAALSCLLMLLLPIAAIALAMPTLVRQIQGLIAALPGLMDKAVRLLESLADKMRAAGVPEGFMLAMKNRVLGFFSADGAQNMADWVWHLGASIPKLAWIIPVPVLAFYFLKDGERLSHAWCRLLPGKSRAEWMALGRDMADALRGFIRAQVGVAAFVGAATGVLLAVFCIPYALLWGVVHFIMNFVPYFGAWIALVPMLAVVAPLGWDKVILSVGIVALVQQIEAIVVAPRLLSSGVDIHPAVVMLLLLAAGSRFGVMGMVMTMPIVLLIRCAASRLYENLVQSGRFKKKEVSDDCQPSKDTV